MKKSFGSDPVPSHCVMMLFYCLTLSDFVLVMVFYLTRKTRGEMQEIYYTKKIIEFVDELKNENFKLFGYTDFDEIPVEKHYKIWISVPTIKNLFLKLDSGSITWRVNRQTRYFKTSEILISDLDSNAMKQFEFLQSDEFNPKYKEIWKKNGNAEWSGDIPFLVKIEKEQCRYGFDKEYLKPARY